MNPYFPLSCRVKRQRGRAGCRVNQQVCFCHTVGILFALQRPQSEVIQSVQKQIIHRQRETVLTWLSFYSLLLIFLVFFLIFSLLESRMGRTSLTSFSFYLPFYPSVFLFEPILHSLALAIQLQLQHQQIQVSALDHSINKKVPSTTNTLHNQICFP